jgi:hypothetical protein
MKLMVSILTPASFASSMVCLGFLAAWGLDLEWGLGLLVKVQVVCLRQELIPLHLHDLVDICGVECFLLSIGVKRLRAVDGAVEQEVCI